MLGTRSFTAGYEFGASIHFRLFYTAGLNAGLLQILKRMGGSKSNYKILKRDDDVEVVILIDWLKFRLLEVLPTT